MNLKHPQFYGYYTGMETLQMMFKDIPCYYCTFILMKKILVANRGEIALRVMKSAPEMGLPGIKKHRAMSAMS
jgi:hypothetical protein